jgi:homoserine dehydrogenase
MNTHRKKTIQIGLVGLGTVGTGVVKILHSQAEQIEKRTGVRLLLKKICVKNVSKKRGVKVPKTMLTSQVNALLRDPEIDILVELIGGIHPAKEIIHRAFLSGKQVVTANKALLAEEGKFIFGPETVQKGWD